MKKFSILFIVTCVILTLGLLLCSCGDQNTTNNSNNEQEVPPADGWEKINQVNTQEMYTKFLLGFTNVAYELSKSKVESKGAVTLDGALSFSVNDNQFYISGKGKYDCSDKSQIRNRAIAVVNMSSEKEITDENRLVTLALYQDNLYVAIGKNKVRFDVSEAQWTKYYPYKMTEPTSDVLKNAANLLNTYSQWNDEPTGLYRKNSNKDEYQYSVDMNLKGTFDKLCSGLTSFDSMDSDLLNNIKEFIASLLGITVDELNSGKTPKCDLKANFLISGNKIQKLSASADIDMSNSNSHIIEGDTLSIHADIEDLVITNQYGSGVQIDFVNDQKEINSYIGYNEAIYSLSVPIKEKGNKASNYNFNVTTRIFQNSRTDNFVMVEYYNVNSKEIDRALYVYNDTLYMFVLREEDEELSCILKTGMDLSDLAARLLVNNLNGKQQLDIYKMVAYLLRNIAFSTKEIDLAVGEEFFTSVWYNFEDMVNYVDSLDPSCSFTESEEVVEFIDFFKTNEAIFIFEYNNEQMLQIVDENDKHLNNIIEMLKNANLNDKQDDEKSQEGYDTDGNESEEDNVNGDE